MAKGDIVWKGGKSCRLRKVRKKRWIGPKGCDFTIIGPRVRVVLRYRRYRGLQVLGISRQTRAGSRWFSVRQFEELGVKKRKPAAEAPQVKHLAAMESNLLAPVQALIEHCALLQYDEGEPRKPGKFFVETVGTAWKITIKDPDTCTQFSVVGETFDKAAESAALLLACEDAPWEPDVWALERAPKKKK